MCIKYAKSYKRFSRKLLITILENYDIVKVKELVYLSIENR